MQVAPTQHAVTWLGRDGPPTVSESPSEAEAAAARSLALREEMDAHLEKLTHKQKLFAELYVLGGNATEAYYAAYDVTAKRSSWHRQEAHAVLGKPHVLRYVRELERAAAQNVIVDVQELIRSDLAIVQASQHSERVTWHEWRA